MTKADIFGTEIKVLDGNIHITLKFSDVHKWHPKTLIEEDITLQEYLILLEIILHHERTKKWESLGDNPITIEYTKTTARIVYKEHYFLMKTKDMYNLAKRELENLYIQGIISI